MVRDMADALLLLSILRQDSRKRLTEISKRTGVPISTLHERLKSLGGSYIHRFTCLLDYEKLGYNIRVKILLKAKKEEKPELVKYICQRPEINSLLKVNNGFDYMIEGIFRNIVEFEAFSESLDERFMIKSKQVFFVVDDLKREGFLSDPELLSLDSPIGPPTDSPTYSQGVHA